MAEKTIERFPGDGGQGEREDISQASNRERAILNLEDQLILAMIARRDADWRIRRAAALKLDDQALLVEILHGDPLPAVRGAAYARLRVLGVKRPFPALDP
jgi:hypothetical protein